MTVPPNETAVLPEVPPQDAMRVSKDRGMGVGFPNSLGCVHNERPNEFGTSVGAW